MKYIEGGICAPKGYKASGVHCGIRSNNKDKNDLSLIASDEMCTAAAVYTTNKVKGAPIEVTKHNIADGKAKAVICNSGNANTCAPNGKFIAEETCALVANELNCEKEDLIVASTGVIGEELFIEPFKKGIPELVKKLDYAGSKEAAKGIMTTDTIEKECAVTFTLGGKECVIGAIAKGSGMIHPNMATMLSFITTDVNISSELLALALQEDIKDSYNQISVDGDTSTNDMVSILANGLSGNDKIDKKGKDYELFCTALNKVTSYLSKKLAEDGEGASKLIICNVENASSKKVARTIAKSVVSSNLFKAAIFGSDANWGRVLCAIGYADESFEVDNIDVSMSSSKGVINVCKGSAYNQYSEEEAEKILSEKEITVNINMNQGESYGLAWGCDLTYDYVKINGDYRS